MLPVVALGAAREIETGVASLNSLQMLKIVHSVVRIYQHKQKVLTLPFDTVEDKR